MTHPRRATVSRRIRTIGGQLFRRVGLLPAGTPNGLGQDKKLLGGGTLPHSVMVFFPDPPGSLHQMGQWYEPLRRLDERHRVVVVAMDSRTARAIRRDSGLDTIVVARYATMDDLLSRSDVKVALYVNDNHENFSNLRFNSMVHARLVARRSGPPDLDNRAKAYDFCLIAGPEPGGDPDARSGSALPFYDANRRCLSIGTTVAAPARPGALPAVVARLVDIRDREAARLHNLRVLHR